MSDVQAGPARSRGASAGALDLLRFGAAAFVVLFHFGSSAPVDLTATYPMLDRGWLATDFFIIVSGYVLGRAYGDPLDDLRLSPMLFTARRLARIWPAHLIVLFGFAARVSLGHSGAEIALRPAGAAGFAAVQLAVVLRGMGGPPLWPWAALCLTVAAGLWVVTYGPRALRGGAQ